MLKDKNILLEVLGDLLAGCGRKMNECIPENKNVYVLITLK